MVQPIWHTYLLQEVKFVVGIWSRWARENLWLGKGKMKVLFYVKSFKFTDRDSFEANMTWSIIQKSIIIDLVCSAN